MGRKTIIILFALASSSAIAAPTTIPASPPATALHCIGETSLMLDQDQKSDTEAFLSISQKSTYLEINGVGSGYAPGKPKMLSSTQANSKIALRPVVAGAPMVDGQFTINVFTGALIVFTLNAQGAYTTLFGGNCKKAEPLF